jgi:PIN domain nuclease of toxin-antitoxin system
VRYLLDTHALIWWWLGDPSLSDRAAAAIGDRDNVIFVSPVSAFEIAIKVRRGKLPALSAPLAGFDETVARDAFLSLPVTPLHAREGGLAQGEHRDPFDRLIAGQALVEKLTVITRDREIAGFGCKTLW